MKNRTSQRNVGSSLSAAPTSAAESVGVASRTGYVGSTTSSVGGSGNRRKTKPLHQSATVQGGSMGVAAPAHVSFGTSTQYNYREQSTNSGNSSSTGGVASTILSTVGVQRQKSNDQQHLRMMKYYNSSNMIYDQHNNNHHQEDPSPWKVIAGGCIMIGMMIVIAGIDFQRPTTNNNIQNGRASHSHSQQQQQQQQLTETSFSYIRTDYRNKNSILWCQYDGNCNFGQSCAAMTIFEENESNDTVNYDFTTNQQSRNNIGICEQIPGTYKTSKSLLWDTKDTTKDIINRDRISNDPCLSRCYKELIFEQYKYFTSSPVVLSVNKQPIISNGRPLGCTMIYSRVLASTNTSSLLESKLEQPYQAIDNSHIIVRNDLFDDTSRRNANTQQFRAYCFQPCQNDTDCTPNPKTVQIHNGKEHAFICNTVTQSCHRNPSYWTQPSTINVVNTKSVDYGIIVTTYAQTNEQIDQVQNLIASILYWNSTVAALYEREMQFKVILYCPSSTFMTSDRLQDMQELFGSAAITIEYMSILNTNNISDIRQQLILDTVHTYNSSVIWFDPYITVRGPFIQPIMHVLHRSGRFIVCTNDDNTIISTSTTQCAISNKIQAYLYPSPYTRFNYTPISTSLNKYPSHDSEYVAYHADELTDNIQIASSSSSSSSRFLSMVVQESYTLKLSYIDLWKRKKSEAINIHPKL